MNALRLCLAVGLLLASGCLDKTTPGTVGSTADADTALSDATGSPDTSVTTDTVPAPDVTAVPDLPPIPDVTPADVTPDGPVMPMCCQQDGECGAGRQCTQGTCVDAAASGRCWDVDDCTPGQECIGAGLCPCGAVCEQWFDGPGYCAEPGQTCLALDESHFGDCDAELGYVFDGAGCQPVSGCGCYGFCDYVYGSEQECQQACIATNGCCQSDTECPDAQVCRSAGGATDCAKPAPPERCWDDSACGSGETCFGAFICGCDADCDGKDAPGICITEQSACTAVPPAAVEEVCDAASLVVFDGTTCVQTAPGVCGCDYFCTLTFTSIDECQAACGP